MEELKKYYKEIDWDFLGTYKYFNMELFQSPWNNLVKRNPPIWFRKIFLIHLLDLHDIWSNQIKGKYKEYYLKLWIFHPNFYDSQIVLAVDDKIAFYNKNFTECSEKNVLFPKNIYSVKGLTRFKWKAFYDQKIIFKKIDELSREDIEWWEINADYKRDIDGDTEYRKNIGYFWINLD